MEHDPEKIREVLQRRHEPASKETRRRMTTSHINKRASSRTRGLLSKINTGTIRPLADRIKNSISSLDITPEEWTCFSSAGRYCIKWIDPVLKVRRRVRAFFKNRCVLCGATVVENGYRFMSVHHVCDNQETACCDNEDRQNWLFATLCMRCHGKIRGKNKDIYTQRIREIIVSQFGGKCMYSLEEYESMVRSGEIDELEYGLANGR